MTACCLETNCTRCCIKTNMILTTSDIQTIEKLGYEISFFVSERNSWLELKNKKGRCVFHNGTLCTIYAHRPEGCVLYPIVYEKNRRMAILDSECPQRNLFVLTPEKEQQLHALIRILQKERTERKKRKKIKGND